jgi:hypothetical protein
MKNFEFFKAMEYLVYNAGEGTFTYESDEGRFNVENKTEEVKEITNIQIENIGKKETFEKLLVKLNGLLGKKDIIFISEDITATYTAKKKIITIHYRRNFENLKEMTYIVSAVKDMYSVEQIDISMMSLSKVTLKLVNDTLKITNVVFYTKELYLKYINEAKKEKSDGKVVLSENHTLEIDNLDTKESLFNVYRNKPEEYFTQNIKGFVEEINAGLKMALMSYIPENTEDYDVTDIAIISETRYIEEKKISLEKIIQLHSENTETKTLLRIKFENVESSEFEVSSVTMGNSFIAIDINKPSTPAGRWEIFESLLKKINKNHLYVGFKGKNGKVEKSITLIDGNIEVDIKTITETEIKTAMQHSKEIPVIINEKIKIMENKASLTTWKITDKEMEKLNKLFDKKNIS